VKPVRLNPLGRSVPPRKSGLASANDQGAAMKKMLVLKISVSLLVCLAFLAPFSGTQAQSDKRAILSQAREAYYNLPREGVKSFQCTIVPNWAAMLEEERKKDPQRFNAALKNLSALRFIVIVTAQGGVTLMHNDLPPENEKMKEGLTHIYRGMQQMTTGFFSTWKIFVLQPPFPAVDSDFQLESVGSDYKLSYREGNVDVVTVMSKNFAISDLKVTSAEFDSSIRPAFTATPKGLLLNGYNASYRSKSPGEATEIKVLLTYQAVQGVEMLQKFGMNGTQGGSPIAVELAFTDCQVAK
jgi:hypothetical protein